MKKLINVTSAVTNGKITITADIADTDKGEFRFPVQQTTVGWINPLNMRWPRHVQISGEATFVKANGSGMAILHDDLVAIAALVEPKTSFPPVFKKSDLTVEVASELNPSYQWQVSDKIDASQSWSNINGQISATLDKSSIKAGQFVRCVASNDSGSMISNPTQVK